MKADLEQGFLGVKWRASAEEVKRVFPDAKSVGDASRPQLFLKAPAGVWGVRPASFLLTVPAQGGFNEVGFSLQAAEVGKAVAELHKGLGKSRHIAIKDAGFYSQVYEWSTKDYGVMIFYPTKETAPSPAIERAEVKVTAGRLAQSLIDEYQRLMPQAKSQ